MATFRLCAGRELNPHAFRHMALNHACLPIPAPARFWMEPRYYSPHTMDVNFYYAVTGVAIPDEYTKWLQVLNDGPDPDPRLVRSKFRCE